MAQVSTRSMDLQSPTVESLRAHWRRMVSHEPMLSPLRFEARRLLVAYPDEYRLRYERLKHLLKPLVGENAWNVELQTSEDWDVAIRFLCRETGI